MKKQFLLAMLLVLAGVFCSILKSNNGLKACDANKTACIVTGKSSFKKMPAIDIEDMDRSFNPFMNPFIGL